MLARARELNVVAQPKVLDAEAEWAASPGIPREIDKLDGFVIDGVICAKLQRAVVAGGHANNTTGSCDERKVGGHGYGEMKALLEC
jgi:hypothetical protein